MKLVVEYNDVLKEEKVEADGIIVGLKDFAVSSKRTYSLEEIKDITKKFGDKEIFVSINKNLFNDEIDALKEILKELDKLKLQGIMFYDLALLKLKKDLHLQVDLVWNQTHMVNNYMTCNYYYDKGVKYAILGKEITLAEIIEIIKLSKIKCMVEVVGKACIAFSKRKLLTNYYKDLDKRSKKNLDILEKVSNTMYEVVEETAGTSFYQKEIMNGCGVIKELWENNCSYIIFRENGLEEIFEELIKDTITYIRNNCQDEAYVNKYKVLGENTNFFFKKTIYKVKKNEKD